MVPRPPSLEPRSDATSRPWASGACVSMRRLLRDILRKLLPAVLTWSVALGAAHSQSVGFDRLEPMAAGLRPFEVVVWYPSISPAHHRIGLHRQKVAYKGLPDGEYLPLVVLSLGAETALRNHADTVWALASAGFVVAATMLPHDNHFDRSGMSGELDRFGSISLVIDQVVIHWRFDVVAPDRVGVFGFSSGAVSALVTVGAEPDLALAAAYCKEHLDEVSCRSVEKTARRMAAPSARRLRDDRVRSAVIVAPALGVSMSRDRLSDVAVPLQLWEAELDRIPPGRHVQAIAPSLAVPMDHRLVRGAGHFDFLAPCDEDLAGLAPDLCVEAPGFRRSMFHHTFNREIVRFFQRTLREGGP